MCISEYERNVHIQLKTYIDELCARTDEYLKSFDNSALMSFSEPEKDIKSYKHNYYIFTSKLNEVLDGINSSIAHLCSFIDQPEQSLDIKLTKRIGRILEANIHFEKSTETYTHNMQKELSDGQISTTALVKATLTFKFAAEEFLRSIQNV